MSTHEQALGPVFRFLLPSVKLKQPGRTGPTVEQDVHTFLMATFDGYTATVGTLFGYWKDSRGEDSYNEHRQFAIACPQQQVDQLKHYLSTLAAEIDEDSIYLEAAGTATLIYNRAPGPMGEVCDSERSL